jgi:probable phosphoglycerate mutase
MGKIILARHGQDQDNSNGILNGRRDSPLTPLGVAQAYGLAGNLEIAGLNIQYIFCSPYERALQTAKVCSDILGVPCLVMNCLIERSHGILEGHPYSDIPKLAKSFKEWNGRIYVIEVEGGEDYPALCERAEDVLSQIEAKRLELQIEGYVLIVFHGALMRAVQVVHAGLNHEHMFEFASPNNCEFLILE